MQDICLEETVMRYTKYNSMNQILSYPNMRKYLEVFYSEYLLDMFPKEYENEPLALAEQFGKTPWGDQMCIRDRLCLCDQCAFRKQISGKEFTLFK